MIAVVKSFNRKKNNIWGIKGYDLPRFNAHMDKPQTIRIVKDTKKNFLDDVTRAKSFVPAPCTYNVEGSLIDPKKNSGLSEGKRLTLVDEI